MIKVAVRPFFRGGPHHLVHVRDEQESLEEALQGEPNTHCNQIEFCEEGTDKNYAESQKEQTRNQGDPRLYPLWNDDGAQDASYSQENGHDSKYETTHCLTDVIVEESDAHDRLELAEGHLRDETCEGGVKNPLIAEEVGVSKLPFDRLRLRRTPNEGIFVHLSSLVQGGLGVHQSRLCLRFDLLGTLEQE